MCDPFLSQFRSYAAMMQSLLSLLSPAEINSCSVLLSLETKEMSNKFDAFPTETFVGDCEVMPLNLKRQLNLTSDAEILRGSESTKYDQLRPP